MLSSLHLPLALYALLLICVPVPMVVAQAPSGFEQVVSEGLRAYQAGEYVEARASFERAHALSPSARTLRVLGMTAVELRRFTAARVELEAALVDTRQPLTESQRAEVAQMLTWLGSTLASVRVLVQPEAAHISVDGQAQESHDSRLLLEPGARELRVEADGYEPSRQVIELSAGEERTVEINLPRAQLAALPPLAPAAQLTAASEQSASRALFTGAGAEPVRDQDTGSVFEKWWFWTAVGAVVAASTTVAVVALSSKHEVPAESPGTKVLILRAGY
jgi:hypothetical protein